MKIEFWQVLQNIIQASAILSRSNKEWYLVDDDGYYHCEDGPAKVSVSGSVYWFNHGVFVRFKRYERK